MRIAARSPGVLSAAVSVVGVVAVARSRPAAVSPAVFFTVFRLPRDAGRERAVLSDKHPPLPVRPGRLRAVFSQVGGRDSPHDGSQQCGAMLRNDSTATVAMARCIEGLRRFRGRGARNPVQADRLHQARLRAG